MQSAVSMVKATLIYVQGKPFSVAIKALLSIVAAATSITFLYAGCIWTLLFAGVFTFLGAVTFLLIVDKHNGGIIKECQLLLPFLQSSLTNLGGFFSYSSATHESVRRATLKPNVGATPPRDLLSSPCLEQIYPWLNLTLPKTLDDSLTKLLEIIIDDYMTKDWYSLVQVRKSFANETRVSLRYCVSRLIRRLKATNCSSLVHEKVCKAMVEHVSVFLTLRDVSRTSRETDLDVLLESHPELAHCAMKSSPGTENSEEDLFYFRISTKILQHLLPCEYRYFSASIAVLREVLTEMVLKNIVEAFSDPHRLNYLFGLALSAPVTEPYLMPDFDLTEVPVLKNLVVEDKPTSTVQKVSFRHILKEPTLKSSFEQYLKSLGLEEFCKINESISWINKFLDSPVLGEAAVMSTYNSLVKLQKEIRVAQSKGCAFSPDFLADVDAVSAAGPSSISKLRQLSSWKSMNYQLNALFDNILVPAFQETRLYHHLLIPPTEDDHKKRKMPKIQRGISRPRPPNPEALQILKETVRGVLKDVPAVMDQLDSESVDDFDGSTGFPDDDFDDLDSELQPVSEDALGSTLRDLSYYDVTVLRAERRRDERGRIVMVLNVTIFDRGPLSPDNNKRWAVPRKYSEFYILDSKIREFHGTLEASSYLPAKKAWTQPSLDFLQQRVADFQKFLQLLVREPKLRYSQMLYNFLATTMEFDSSGFPDLGLGKVIRNVPQILTQERGQNIESFVRSLLNVALPSKIKLLNDVPVSKEPVQIDAPLPFRTKFEPLVVDPPAIERELCDFKGFEGVLDELMYLATTLLKTDPELLGVFACLHSFAGPYVEDLIFQKIDELVEFVQDPQQLTFIVDVLSRALTTTYPPISQEEVDIQSEETLEKFLLIARSSWAEIICGGSSEDVARLAFDALQYKVLNKRLVMILLDLIVVELFPELDGSKTLAVKPAL